MPESDKQFLSALCEEDGTHINSIQFNQDAKCFTVSYPNGFQIFNSEPCISLKRIIYEDGGLAFAEMLLSTNIIALVGGGAHPKYPTNQVVLYDDKAGEVVAQIEFRAEVKAVRIRHGLLAVGLKNRVFIYRISETPMKLASFDAHDCLSKATLSMSMGQDAVVAFPGQLPGSIQLLQVSQSQVKQSGIINSHDSNIACLALNSDGSKGTILRVYDTDSGRLNGEFRRGADQASVHQIVFNKQSTKIAVASEKGTVHIFSTLSGLNPKLPSIMRSVLPKYFKSEWSFAQVYVREGKCAVAFSTEQGNALLVVQYDGLWHKFVFDEERGGEGVKVETKSI